MAATTQGTYSMYSGKSLRGGISALTIMYTHGNTQTYVLTHTHAVSMQCMTGQITAFSHALGLRATASLT